MTDRTLPPLPTPGVPNTRLPLDRAWKDGSFAADQMTAYAITALAPLEAENAALRARVAELEAALGVARKAIQDERDEVFECHTAPGETECHDALGLQWLRESDAILRKIDTALRDGGKEAEHG